MFKHNCALHATRTHPTDTESKKCTLHNEAPNLVKSGTECGGNAPHAIVANRPALNNKEEELRMRVSQRPYL